MGENTLCRSDILLFVEVLPVFLRCNNKQNPLPWLILTNKIEEFNKNLNIRPGEGKLLHLTVGRPEYI